MNSTFDVITIGSATVDIFFQTDRAKVLPDPGSIEGNLLAFALGSKITIEDAYFSDGGGACNTATCFARLGLKTSAYLNVGNDEMGQRVIAELMQEGADTTRIWVDERLRTGTSVILIPEGMGERTILFYPGANRSLDITDWDKIQDTSWLYVSSITRQAPQLLPRIVEFAQENSIKLANNPGTGQIEQGFYYMAPILQKLDVLIVNRAEAILLLQSKDPDMKIPQDRDLAAELGKIGPKTVVVTCGADGSYVSCDGEVCYQEAIPADMVDATGAGDAFGSTFVAATIMERDMRTALNMAAINSASVVSCLGAQEGLLRLDEIQRKAFHCRTGTEG